MAETSNWLLLHSSVQEALLPLIFPLGIFFFVIFKFQGESTFCETACEWAVKDRLFRNQIT